MWLRQKRECKGLEGSVEKVGSGSEPVEPAPFMSVDEDGPGRRPIWATAQRTKRVGSM